MLTFGSLFAGIGGFDLGFERAGMTCSWQVEIDDYANRVLAKHWPQVRRHSDVRTFPQGPEKEWEVDIVCGGFPCTDISLIGRGAGIKGEKSGLWSEFARIVGILRPRFVVVENVPGLIVRGLDRVLGDLASLGFDAEWSVLSACAMGASHTRERVFILGYAAGKPPRGDAGPKEDRGLLSEFGVGCGDSRRSWASESGIPRTAARVPFGLDRNRCLGNAVVPQISEWIGRRLLKKLENPK